MLLGKLVFDVGLVELEVEEVVFEAGFVELEDREVAFEEEFDGEVGFDVFNEELFVLLFDI